MMIGGEPSRGALGMEGRLHQLGVGGRSSNDCGSIGKAGVPRPHRMQGSSTYSVAPATRFGKPSRRAPGLGGLLGLQLPQLPNGGHTSHCPATTKQ